MLKAAKNMRGKLALLYRVTGRPGHRLRIFLNSTYEQKTGLRRNSIRLIGLSRCCGSCCPTRFTLCFSGLARDLLLVHSGCRRGWDCTGPHGLGRSLNSAGGSPLPTGLQNRACDFHRTRLLNGMALVMGTSCRGWFTCIVSLLSHEPDRGR